MHAAASWVVRRRELNFKLQQTELQAAAGWIVGHCELNRPPSRAEPSAIAS
jgi:hypothetical protein